LHVLPGWLSATVGAARSVAPKATAISATTNFFIEQILSIGDDVGGAAFGAALRDESNGTIA
jgi:hypothetical protein